MDPAVLDDLTSITGLSVPEATILLEASGGDLSTAVSLHFEQEEVRAAPQSGAEDTREGDANQHATPSADTANSSDQHDAAAHAVTPAEPQYYGWVLGLFGNLPGISVVRGVVRRLGGLLRRSGLLTLVASVIRSLVFAPLTTLGLHRRPPFDGAGAIRRFVSGFEDDFGAVHPTFFVGTFMQALVRARHEAKFLLVYVHSAGRTETTTFCRDVLGSELFAAFVNENFIFWVSDAATSEGRDMRHQLRLRDLPALAVLSHSEMVPRPGVPRGTAQALGTVHGLHLLSEERAIAALTQLLERFEAILEGARLERRERDVDRMLREEQEAEYARSLAEDQAREADEAAAVARAELEGQQRQELEAAEARRAQEEDAAARAQREARVAKAATLPDEPATGGTHVIVRMPDGQRLSRRFPKSCCLQVVVDWIESSEPDIEDFDLVINYPRKEFTAEHRAVSLEELGLHPAATLFTKEQ
mmetsp:Transcript_22643/g.37410  ORF Transcript_22643/g.37410 Transcript_22643/m.37410 type:complete len:474 (+) Transcript_22643:54-1475(+)|eukprot:CAMPEP_0119306694 /NCGR_PEP_ID=MMETSP1333-20130426/7385_1 /TAXON_ID=418940 /ORGANISM="Scyphosphaera apsteinii, Strain RCC1455" /LENGTH=473 /DNA_ID=CAMNT_0007310061 /DNA_START=54 /DNA_END=1475 /DNA_ORIENTATION=-